jgi:crossover junction endodeoxyribonuclease RusA
VIRLTLPIMSANKYWHPVHVGGHISIVPTSKAKQYKKDVAWLLKAAGVREPVMGRVAIDVKLYPHRPLDYKKRMKADPIYWADTVRCIDLDNCIKVLLDAFKGLAIEDDSMVHRIASERMDPDGRDECAVVTITPIVLDSPQATLQLPDPVRVARVVPAADKFEELPF